jgi:hypothetical protein
VFIRRKNGGVVSIIRDRLVEILGLGCGSPVRIEVAQSLFIAGQAQGGCRETQDQANEERFGFHPRITAGHLAAVNACPRALSKPCAAYFN